MKKILFFINSLEIGGGEKSLISLLSLINYKEVEVHLLMLKNGENLEKNLPREVKILKIPEYYRYLNNKSLDISIIKKIKFNISKLKSSFQIRLIKYKKKCRNNQQIFYENQRRFLENIKGEYDVAIAYAQGFPTYFVGEKVTAKKKYAWINCDYKNTMYDKSYDEKFYKEYMKIIAVSEEGKKSIIEVNKRYEEKTVVIKDIVDPKLIKEMAEEEIKDLKTDKLVIVTVARLVLSYKGYDLLIKSAKILKAKNIKFYWYVVGDGQDRERIKDLIESEGVQENVILLGAKMNPYPYTRKADIYVQPSRLEGFGLTVVEAMILKRKIICTRFKTAENLIKDGENGLLAQMNEESIANGIIRMMEDKVLNEKIEKFYREETEYDSKLEFDNFLKLIEGEEINEDSIHPY